MTKQTNATIETKLHQDGAVSHKIIFPDGSSDLIVISANDELRQQFVAHGSRAKIQAAVNSATEKVSAAEKVAALAEAFAKGHWTMNEGAAKPKGSSLVRALAALKGSPIEEAEAYVKGLSRAEQAKLRANPLVAAKIITLESEDRSEASGDLLAGFLEEAEGDAQAAA